QAVEQPIIKRRCIIRANSLIRSPGCTSCLWKSDHFVCTVPVVPSGVHGLRGANRQYMYGAAVQTGERECDYRNADVTRRNCEITLPSPFTSHG
ncbi:hypothetical protein K0M31_013605, partial [Melipona bicolor]